jgi:hypothetical protein
MPSVIVELERGPSPGRRHDAPLIAALLIAASAFAVAVWTVPALTTSAPAPVAAVDTSAVQRSVVLHALQLPAGAADVDLEWMPERLTNEASPSSLRDVITVRGMPGVASVEAPAVISWSEAGVVYWLISPTRSTSELIKIADLLAP